MMHLLFILFGSSQHLTGSNKTSKETNHVPRPNVSTQNYIQHFKTLVLGQYTVHAYPHFPGYTYGII